MTAEKSHLARAGSFPPGPRTIYHGQHLLALFRTPLEFLLGAAKYGDVVRLNTGSRDTYLLNHPDFIRDVLVTNHRQFTKNQFLRRMRGMLGDGLLTSEDDLHLRQRRLIQPAFHRQRLSLYAEIMTGYAEQVSNHWHDALTIDVQDEMMRMTMVIVGKALFGADVESEANEIGEALTTLQRGSRRMLLPFWERIQTLPLPENRRLLKAAIKVDGAIRGLIAERRAEIAGGVNGERSDLLDMLLYARDEEGDGQGMTDELVRDEVMTLFLAGHETTAVALTWSWYLLSQHPLVEDRLHAELDSVLGRRVPKMSDIDRLTYTRQVFTEVMRLYPPAWVVGRQAKGDYNVDGFRLPAGATVLMSQWVVHHDPRWYSDPWVFDPDRWAEPPDDRRSLQNRPRFAYFPFGGGPRVCVGESFAWMEGILVLATLAQKWRLRLADGHPVALMPQITLRPKNGMKMVVVQR